MAELRLDATVMKLVIYHTKLQDYSYLTILCVNSTTYLQGFDTNLFKYFDILSHFDLNFQPSCAIGRADIFDILRISQFVFFFFQ